MVDHNEEEGEQPELPVRHTGVQHRLSIVLAIRKAALPGEVSRERDAPEGQEHGQQVGWRVLQSDRQQRPVSIEPGVIAPEHRGDLGEYECRDEHESKEKQRCHAANPKLTRLADRLRIVEPQQSYQVSSRIFTIPNILSFVRLLLVPVFLVLIVRGEDGLALLVLVFSSITDFLDGVIARKLNQVTRLGQLLDPAADRLFIFTALIGLAVRGVIPWWLVIVIVGRDVMLAILGVTLANFGYGPLPVHHLGKVATFCLFYALPILMIGQAFPAAAWITVPFGWAFALWGAFLYWWAGIIYLRETVRVTRIPRPGEVIESDTLKR